MTTEEKLAIAVAALRAIKTGSEVTGRWIDALSAGEAIDGYDSPDEVPEGYYDNTAEDPAFDASCLVPLYPDNIDRADYCHLRLVKGAWLTPAYWETYTEEEQSAWVSTCADRAAIALAKIEAEPAP